MFPMLGGLFKGALYLVLLLCKRETWFWIKIWENFLFCSLRTIWNLSFGIRASVLTLKLIYICSSSFSFFFFIPLETKRKKKSIWSVPHLIEVGKKEKKNSCSWIYINYCLSSVLDFVQWYSITKKKKTKKQKKNKKIILVVSVSL